MDNFGDVLRGGVFAVKGALSKDNIFARWTRPTWTGTTIVRDRVSGVRDVAFLDRSSSSASDGAC